MADQIPPGYKITGYRIAFRVYEPTPDDPDHCFDTTDGYDQFHEAETVLQGWVDAANEQGKPVEDHNFRLFIGIEKIPPDSISGRIPGTITNYVCTGTCGKKTAWPYAINLHGRTCKHCGGLIQKVE